MNTTGNFPEITLSRMTGMRFPGSKWYPGYPLNIVGYEPINIRNDFGLELWKCHDCRSCGKLWTVNCPTGLPQSLGKAEEIYK